MYDILLPVTIYLIDSVLSGMYMQGFLKRKYEKRTVSAAWGTVYFFIQIVVFEVLDGILPVGELAGITLNIFAVLFLQFIFFEKDVQKQLFTAFSFVAGKENVKYIASVFHIAVNGICNKVLDYLVAEEIINSLEKSFMWIKSFFVHYCGFMRSALRFSIVRIFCL